MHNKILILFCLSLITYGRSFAQQVTTEMAQRVAQTFFAAQNKSDNSNISVLSWGNREQPTMYAISAPNRWVLIAGDRRVQPILAYSDEGKGTFPEIEDMPPAMLELLEWYSSQIDSLREQSTEINYNTLWSVFLNGGDMPITHRSVIVGPLLYRNGIENVWKQSSNNTIGEYSPYAQSYNKYCPAVPDDTPPCTHALVGCVAIATSQIMWYWQWPYTAIIKDDSGSQHIRNYNWDLMPSAIYNNTPVEKVDMIANLLHDVGVVVGMRYGCDSSTAYSDSIVFVLRSRFYYHADDLKNRNDYSNSIWTNILKDELNSLRPVAYAGCRAIGGKGYKCHEFVIDGYDSENKFHINFGWGGNHNAYFTLDSIYNNYNYLQTAITNIQPSYPSCTAVTNPISFMLFTNPSYTLPNLVLQNGGAITLGSRTIASGKHISVISGDYVRLNSGLKVENGAYAYFDVQDMHCDDDLTDEITSPINREQMPIKKNEKTKHTEDPQPQKLLLNGQIYILRGDKTYTVTGQEVK